MENLFFDDTEINNTACPYPIDRTMMDILEENVRKFSDKIAVKSNEESITYKELNQKANSLAVYLRAQGVTNNTIVGIMLPRCISMIVGIFAIMKAGGAYVPIDHRYPKERIQYIIDDSKLKLLLTYNKKLDDLVDGIQIIDLADELYYENANENLCKITKPDDLAYVIYTSGSTGRPKGVLIEHKSLMNRINWMQKAYPIDEHDVVMQKTVYTFDVSVWEIFWWSMEGATLFLLQEGKEHNPKVISNAVIKHNVSVMHFVPSVFNIFLEYVGIKDNAREFSTMRYIFCSGEALQWHSVDEFYKLFGKQQVKLINLYGPTEATVDVTYFDCINYQDYKSIPIGKPIDNTTMYILNEDHAKTAIGEIAELYIGGVGLARSYMNRKELTDEKFVIYENISPDRLYKTGDLARWLPDGNIDFIGRSDFQIKLRGLRIETGEIECNLVAVDTIMQAVVLLVKDAMEYQYLCAFVVTSEPLVKENIVEHLSKVLPDYMIPNFFVPLTELPIKPNGKVDREKLLDIYRGSRI